MGHRIRWSLHSQSGKLCPKALLGLSFWNIRLDFSFPFFHFANAFLSDDNKFTESAQPNKMVNFFASAFKSAFPIIHYLSSIRTEKKGNELSHLKFYPNKNLSQIFAFGFWQFLHFWQCALGVGMTVSPGRKDSTPGPTDSTIPAPSWPKISGKRMVGSLPSHPLIY
jgi:hypothetical protein